LLKILWKFTAFLRPYLGHVIVFLPIFPSLSPFALSFKKVVDSVQNHEPEFPVQGK
jgi:hypothetical protein